MDHVTKTEESRMKEGARLHEIAAKMFKTDNERMKAELKVRMSIIHNQEACIDRLESDLKRLTGQDNTSNG